MYNRRGNKVKTIPVVQELCDEVWDRYRMFWYPFDVGQALKLTVYLGIDIIHDKIAQQTVAKYYVGSELVAHVSIRRCKMRSLEPTRRAIVLVAAEIAEMLDTQEITV